jgi:uncharacterized protein DUF4328
MSMTGTTPDAVRRSHASAVIVIALLVAGAVLDVVGAASGLAQLRLLQGAAVGREIADATAAANDARQALIGGVQAILFVITAIFFLIWIFRAYKALEALGHPSEQFTPGWAVGYWFIPFLNLYRPYQIVKELWLKSAAASAAARADSEVAPPAAPVSAPALIGWWWAVWLIDNALGRALMQQVRTADTLDELIRMSQTAIFSDLFSLVPAALAIAIVRGIDRLQLRGREPVAA